MIRTILSLAVLTSFAATAAVKAEPSPSKQSAKKKTETSKAAPANVSAPTLKSGWSLVNGVWTHPDGYQFIKGKVIRVATQTHKSPPPPPTKAEMEAAMKKKPAAKTPAEIAAEKEAQRQRNLMPSRPASQTGTRL